MQQTTNNSRNDIQIHSGAAIGLVFCFHFAWEILIISYFFLPCRHFVSRRDSSYYAVSELDVVHKNLLATRSRNKKNQIPKVLHFLKSHENRKQTSNFAH